MEPRRAVLYKPHTTMEWMLPSKAMVVKASQTILEALMEEMVVAILAVKDGCLLWYERWASRDEGDKL